MSKQHGVSIVEFFKGLIKVFEKLCIDMNEKGLDAEQRLNVAQDAIDALSNRFGLWHPEDAPKVLWPHMLWAFYARRPESQAYFAQQLGCSQPYVSQVLRGKRSLCSKQEFRRWLNVFGYLPEQI